MLLLIARMIEELTRQIRAIEIKLLAWHRANPACQRLETIPGIGLSTATALAATVSDARVLPYGRQFDAWLGLGPKQPSSGGKDRMGGVSKMSDRHLRHLLVLGGTAVVRYTRRKATTVSKWANQLLERKPTRLVTVAVATKLARIGWAVMAHEESYRAVPVASRCRSARVEHTGSLKAVWAGENDRCDVKPVKPGIEKTWAIQRASSCASLMRTRSTDTIMASGLAPRATGRTHEWT